jgi:membrane fusion protein, multidrug efflux system
LSFKKEGFFLKKQMIIMLLLVGILFGLIFGWKQRQAILNKQFLLANRVPVVTVSTTKVTYSLWESRLQAVVSLRARLGVNVTTSLAEIVQTIYFTPGTKVEKGTILVQLNADTEIGQLNALKAQVELAKITYQRDKAQYAIRGVSRQQVDSDEWNLKNLQAQVASQAATVEKKTIRAPFSGILGINNVNPGQYLSPGDAVTTLQALDPIYADFFLPQQYLARLKFGQAVTVMTDAFPKQIFRGKITTIQPLVDAATRNVQVEATIANPRMELRPGMFAAVDVNTEVVNNYLTLPQTAITFNPFGDLVYLVKDSGKKNSKNQPIFIANQVFVTVGETRGDQIAVLKGLKYGDIVVTSGQLKLKNGSKVVVNNTVQPSNEAAPKVEERS